MDKTCFLFLSMLLVFQVCALDEQSINLKVGDTITSSLLSNRSTGYRWILKNPESESISSVASNRLSTIKYESNYVAPNSEPGANATKAKVGVAGTENWTFSAKKPGAVDVQLDYMRSWDPNSVAKSMIIHFNVQQ